MFVLFSRIEKVAPQSPAGSAGLKNQDYLVKINGKEVFDMNHNDLVRMVRDWKEECLELEIERYCKSFSSVTINMIII